MWRSDFARKFMSNSVAQGLSFGSRWLLNLVLARHMLQAEFGEFSLLYMLANLFYPTIAFGVNFYLIHHAAQGQSIRSLLSSLVISSLVFLLLSVITISLVLWQGGTIAVELYVLSLLIGLLWAWSQGIFCYLKGKQQFAIEVQSQLLGALVTMAIASVVFFLTIADTLVVLALVACASLPALVQGLRAIYPELRHYLQMRRSAQHQPSAWLTWHDLKQRWVYAWHDVFAIYLTNIPFVFLAMFSTLEALGQFRKAFILFMPVTLLPVVFSQVLLAKLSRNQDLTTQWQFFRRVSMLTLPLLSLPYLCLGLTTAWLYPWLLNESYTAETALISHLVLLTLWLTLVKTYAEVWLTALGFSQWRALNVTLIALLGSLAYLVNYHQLSSERAAWIFMITNATAVLSLVVLSLLAYQQVEKKATLALSRED
jgi:O-antigen/teichoic acid export membrane protein